MSLFSLQSSMISAFGSDPGFKHTMDVCVGVGSCAVICAMSIIMVARGVRRLRRIKREHDA